MKQQIYQQILDAVKALDIEVSEQDLRKIQVEYPESSLGDYSSNVALILSKKVGMKPQELAGKIKEKISDTTKFEKIEVAGPGFLNFTLDPIAIIEKMIAITSDEKKEGEKILLEYFQPNIAKPLHIGHMRTAVIGDAIKRMLKYTGANVESDTHMGDWGTQFGFLILGVKQHGSVPAEADLNRIYVELNAKAENDLSVRETAKAEFVKLEQGDAENRKIWKELVAQSVQKFMDFAEEIELLPFENHWPESFYEDKMPAVLESLKEKQLIKESQGAQIVDLEEKGLGVAIIIKSDGGSTYLLRDLATFIFAKNQGYKKHLYVVDSRQSLHYKQLFEILKMMGEMEEGEGVHIDYGFMSFKGEALSTRKGNMVLADEVLAQAKEKAGKIIAEKNPDLKEKEAVVDAIGKGAIKYFDLSHNRHSDIEFDWEQALDFEGNSGPYLQYTHARLASIIRKHSPEPFKFSMDVEKTDTEKKLLFTLSIFDEKVQAALENYLPNVFANYLYELATITNRFYHENPVLKEEDENKKQFRLYLVETSQLTLAKGLGLLGIKAPDEM
ncbi:MAG TPA: arginine--tRNA ligase [Candidatus Binatia bacterium]|nr:arginine--tRNA ligase [Candidatus Binatia bacterium]